MFLGHPGSGSCIIITDLDLDLDLLSPSKNNKKTLDFYYFVATFDFLPLKTDVIVPS
jgi:hypothetical protein